MKIVWLLNIAPNKYTVKRRAESQQWTIAISMKIAEVCANQEHSKTPNQQETHQIITVSSMKLHGKNNERQKMQNNRDQYDIRKMRTKAAFNRTARYKYFWNTNEMSRSIMNALEKAARSKNIENRSDAIECRHDIVPNKKHNEKTWRCVKYCKTEIRGKSWKS